MYDKEFKNTLFADDATFALDGSFKSFNDLINILDAFKSISGIKLYNKKNSVFEYMKQLKFSWSSESAKTLGIAFFSERNRMQEYNLLPKLCEFGTCLKRWGHNKFTLMGKITVVKTLHFQS